MCRTDNSVRIDETATAEVRSGELNADDEGKVALGGSYATNDIRGVLIPVLRVVLRDSCTRDDGRDRKSDEERFGVHVGKTRERWAGGSLSEREATD